MGYKNTIYFWLLVYVHKYNLYCEYVPSSAITIIPPRSSKRILGIIFFFFCFYITLLCLYILYSFSKNSRAYRTCVWKVLFHDSLPWIPNVIWGCQSKVFSWVSWSWHVSCNITGKWVGVICMCRILSKFELRIVSMTNGNCMYLCIVVFLTYRGKISFNLKNKVITFEIVIFFFNAIYTVLVLQVTD
jgi:hypothetical protein